MSKSSQKIKNLLRRFRLPLFFAMQPFILTTLCFAFFHSCDYHHGFKDTTFIKTGLSKKNQEVSK